MRIFLTGDIQVGKTTIIKKYLERAALSADGFLTYWKNYEDGASELFLAPCGSGAELPAQRLARRAGGEFIKDVNIEDIFNIHGTKILEASGKRDVIIMDELGILESDALAFQDAVLRRISGDIPVLGVIKPAETGFLNAVRAQDGVTIREVTQANRDDVLSWLTAQKRR